MAVNWVHVDDAISSASDTITIPATASAGDVAFLFDTAANGAGNGIPAKVVPTGWTEIVSFTTSANDTRITISYKILEAGDPGSDVTGQTGVLRTKNMTVVGSDADPIDEIRVESINSEATDGNPAQQTVTGSNASGPIVTFANWVANATFTSDSFSPARDGENDNNPASGEQITAWRFDNLDGFGDPTAQDTTVDMPDEGIQGMASFYVVPDDTIAASGSLQADDATLNGDAAALIKTVPFKTVPLIAAGVIQSGTLTRNSTATYWDASSELQTAAIDTARTDHAPADGSLRGFLSEEGRENREPDSIDFTAWGTVGNPVVTANTHNGPDGTLTADTVQWTGGGTPRIIRTPTIPDDNNPYIFGIKVHKTAGTSDVIRSLIRCQGGATNPASSFTFDRTIGAFTDAPSEDGGVEDHGDYWFVWHRVTNNNSGNTTLRYEINKPSDDTTSVVWGAQLEQAKTPTSFKLTTGTAATREADNATDTISTWPVPVSLEIVATPSADQDGVLYQADDGTENNRVRFERISGNLHVIVTNGAAEQCNLDLGALTDFIEFTVRAAFADNDIAASLNGAAVVTDSSATIPTGLTTRRYGKDTAGEHWNAWIRDIDEHFTRLPDSSLESGVPPATNLQAGPASVDGSADVFVEVSGDLTPGLPALSGSAEALPPTLTGALQAATPGFSASATVDIGSSGALTPGPATLASTVRAIASGVGALQAGPAALSATAKAIVGVLAALQPGAPVLSGEAEIPAVNLIRNPEKGGYKEAHDPIGIRSKNDIGPAYQRPRYTIDRVILTGRFILEPDEVSELKAWYFNDLDSGEKSFAFVHPRTGVDISARLDSEKGLMIRPMGAVYLVEFDIEIVN